MQQWSGKMATVKSKATSSHAAWNLQCQLQSWMETQGATCSEGLENLLCLLHVYVHIHLSVSMQTYSSLVLFPPMTVHGCMPVWCSVSLCVYESFWTHTPELIPLNTHCSCGLYRGVAFFLPLFCLFSANYPLWACMFCP